ncbi:MAG: DUF4236 domain-containing protein [Solirubrobacteraceae bacterium]
MSWQFRRSVKVMPGVRLNVTKRGIGASVGVGPLRRSWHSTGRRTSTFRVPGTGLYWTKSTVKPEAGAPTRVTKRPPGVRIAAWEVAFREGIEALVNGDPAAAWKAFDRGARSGGAPASADAALLAALVGPVAGADPGAVARHAAAALQAASLPGPATKAIGGLEVPAEPYPGVTMLLAPDAAPVILVLADALQSLGQAAEARAVLQDAVDDGAPNPVRVRLIADLLIDGEAEAALRAAVGLSNTDDAALAAATDLAAVALDRGRPSTGLALLNDATRRRSADPELLARARLRRGVVRATVGDVARARTDLRWVCDHAPHLTEARERLANL